MRGGRRRGWGSRLLYARTEWRSKWSSHLALAGVVAVAVAAVVASLGAAARSETAFERLRTATNAADLAGSFSDTGSAEAAAGAIARIDGVEGAAAEAELFVRPVGTEYFPDYNLYSRAPLAASASAAVNTPVITTGRAVNANRSDEIAISEDLAAELGVSVGETVALESMTAKWVDVAFNGGDPGPPDGPKMKAVAVGLSRTPADFARWDGLIHLSPAFVERYEGRMMIYASVQVRLAQHASRQAVGDAVGKRAEEVDVSSRLFAGDDATGGLNAIATALRIMAAVAALAGGVVIALALARATRLGLGDRRVLAALGWTTRQLTEAAVFVFAPWLFVGVGLGLLGGVLVTPRVMVGLALSVDPAPNSFTIHAVVVLGVGAVAVAFGLLIVGFTARWFARARTSRAPFPTRILRLSRPLPMVLGVRHALAGEVERGGRASRGALMVLAVGMAGAVAALMVSASMMRLQTDPTLSGQGAARVIDSGESVEVYDRALPRLENDSRVAVLVGIHIMFGISADASEELTTLAYDIRRGDSGVSVIRGHVARQPDEVALGPATLDRLGKDIGDRIELRSKAGAAVFRIVGSVLFPEGDFEHDAGIALTMSGADRVVGNAHDAANLHLVVFEWDDKVDARRADRQLTASGLRVFSNREALKPASVTNLGEVVTVPRYLAAFLGILSLATFGHALSTSVRRRSRELVTLRALGMTPRANSAVVASHALTVVGIATVIGVPIGVALGNWIWRPIAEGAHVVVLSVIPADWIARYVALIVVGAVCLTAVLAWRAHRLCTADILHAE